VSTLSNGDLLLIAYLFSNISAKNYQNRLMCIEVIAKNVMVIFFETQCTGYPTDEFAKSTAYSGSTGR